MEEIQTVRRVQRVRHELRRRDVTVVRAAPLGAEFVRVVFTGETLGDFVSLGFDDHVKFMFDDGRGDLVRRDYTPRRFDRERRELTIDFALHGDGLVSDWARQAAAGQPAFVGGPRGSMIVPVEQGWHLLAGDAAAVPAIARRLEELPQAAQVTVVVQLADLAALELERCAARVAVQQVASAEALVAAIGAWQLPAGDGYAWCAGEAGAMARIRQILVGDKALARDALHVAAYWKRGAADFHDERGH